MSPPPGHSSATPGRTALQPARPRDRECRALGVGSALEAQGAGDPRREPRWGRGLEQGAGCPRPALPAPAPGRPGSNLLLRFLLAAPPRSGGPSPARVPPACRSPEPTDGRTDASDEGTSGRRRGPEQQVSAREVPDPMLPTPPGAARTDDGPTRASASPGAGATRGSGQVCGRPARGGGGGQREASGREGTAPGPQAVRSLGWWPGTGPAAAWPAPSDPGWRGCAGCL